MWGHTSTNDAIYDYVWYCFEDPAMLTTLGGLDDAGITCWGIACGDLCRVRLIKMFACVVKLSVDRSVSTFGNAVAGVEGYAHHVSPAGRVCKSLY